MQESITKYDINSKTKNDLLNDYKAIHSRVIELLTAQNRLDILVKELAEKEEKERKIRDKNGIVGNIFMLISLLIFLFLCNVEGLIGFIIGIIIAFILSAIGLHLDSLIIKDKYIKQANDFHKQTVNPLYKKVDECKIQIENIWETYEMNLYEQIIPEEYRSIEILEYFIHVLEIGRASNQKEVLNLFEEAQHRQRMENAQQEILNVQKEQLSESKKQNQSLELINRKQQKISRQVKYGNTINTIDFLFKKH